MTTPTEPMVGMFPKRPRRLGFAIALLALTLVVSGGGIWIYLHSSSSGDVDAAKQTYYCPMHPSYKSDKPGNCPICSMKLVPLGPASSTTGAPPESAAEEPKATQSPTGMSSSSGEGSSIRITPERQQEIGIRFATVTQKPTTEEIRAVGKVAHDETRIAHVHTKVSGWIEEVFVNFVGATVRKGQPLFTIYSPDLVASQEEYLLALRAEKELGQSSFSRVADGSHSLVEHSRRRLEFWDLTPGQIETLEKRGEVSRTVTVFSPVQGVVTERAVYHHGRTVTPEIDLYTIVDLSSVWILAQVYEYELPHVHVGQAAEAVLPYDPERKPLKGKVTFVQPFLDPATRTVQVRMEFPNPDLALKPETFVNVLLRQELGPRLVVPRDAVMDTGVHQYVFVDKGDGYLEPREVRAGPEVAEGRIIAEGLREGERVATAANFILDSESRLKGAFDAMTRPSPGEGPSAGSGARLTAEVITDPSPAKVGRNMVRVRVKDAGGRPITDAEVEIRLFMPQMGAMAPMEARATLAPAGGEYVGDVEIPMAWTWTATITVRRGGRIVGAAETSITAR